MLKICFIAVKTKNNLPRGRLDIETLKKLDVYKYRDIQINIYDGYQYENSPRYRN